MKLPLNFKFLNTSEDSMVKRWTGILIILQAVLSVMMFLFLPEVLNRTSWGLVIWFFVMMVVAGGFIYYSPNLKNRKLQYLPYLVLPWLFILGILTLPSVGYYFLFLFFVTTTAFALNWQGKEIIYYLAFAILGLIIFSFKYSRLPFGAAFFLSLSLIASLVLFGFLQVLIAKTLQHRHNAERKSKKLAWMVQLARKRDRALLNTIHDGIILLDHEEKITTMNGGAVKLLGWKIKEVAGKKMAEVLGTGMELFENVNSKKMFFGDFLAGTVKATEIRVNNKDGKTVFLNITASPMTLQTKKYLAKRGFMLTLHDITQEVELERMKLDFVAMAAHELRTPITSIKGYLTEVIEGVGKTLDTDNQMYLDRALNSTKSMQILMENLLSITKIEKGGRQISKMAMNWETFIPDKLRDFQALARDRHLSLTWQPPTSPLPQVMADPFLIVEVLNNLVANAMNYTAEGGVTVSADYDATTNTVVTHIKDTGQGIPKEKIHRLFERFYRVSGILEKGHKGTGLGLFICKKIVEQHGGKIWVESEGEGKGTTFNFSLEVAPPVASQPTP